MKDSNSNSHMGKSDKDTASQVIRAEGGSTIRNVTQILTQSVNEKIFRRLGLEQRIGFILLAIIVILTGLGVIFVLHQALQPKAPSRMSGDFRIAVAGFAENGGDSSSPGIGLEFAQGVYLRLERNFEQMNLGFIVTIWGPEQVGTIEGQNRDERASSAEQIAQSIAADVVVYGVVDTTDVVWYVVPEFYVSLKSFYEAEEIVGQYEIGTPIPIPGQGEIADRIDLSDELASRVKALSDLTVGLSYYAIRNFERALMYFETAGDVPGWEDSEGKEVAYLLAGNAAGKDGDLELAKQYYDRAQAVNPDYARVYAGLGNVCYDQAVAASTDNANEAALILLDESIEYYRQALHVEMQPIRSDIEPKAHFGLGRAYLWKALLENGDMGQAAQEFKWVIADYNESPDARLRERAAAAHASLGLIYRLSAEDELSIAEYKQAIDLIEDIPQLREQLATYYAALGDEYVDAGRLAEAAVAYQHAIQSAVSEEMIADYQERLEHIQSQIGGPL